MEHSGTSADPLSLDWPLTRSATEADAEAAAQYAKTQESWTARLRLVIEQQAVRVLSHAGLSVRKIARTLNMSIGNVHRYRQADAPAPESADEARWARESVRTAWGQVVDEEVPVDPNARRQPAVAVARDHFLFLSEMAAEGMAHNTADMMEHASKFLQPGDPLGTILCLAWRGDPGYARLAFGAYFRELQQECDRRGLECPTRERVLRTIELFTLNPARFPDIDVSALAASLR